MIYVTRHGQSLTNVGLYPHLDPNNAHGVLSNDNIVLTEQGIGEAMEYGRKAKDRDISLIYTSPYARARQTAHLIASMIGTMVPIEERAALEELKWCPRSFDKALIDKMETQAQLQHPIDRILTSDKTLMHSYETQRTVMYRVEAEMKAICKAAIKQDRNVLVVTHFFPARAIWAISSGLPPEEMVKFTPSNLTDILFDPEDFLQNVRK